MEINNNNINENANISPKEQEDNAPLIQDKAEESFFGKFKTKESLIKSYQNLEQELTKKATKLKEIEKDLELKQNDSKFDGKVKTFLKDYPIANNYLKEIEDEFLKDNKLFEDDNCLEKTLLKILCAKKEENRQNSVEIKEKIPNPSLTAHSELPSILPNKPKSLKDAQKLALELIAKNKQ